MNIKNKTIILKVGTASITNANGSLNERVMVDLIRQVQQLIGHYKAHVILVSSGAVGTGKKYFKHFSGSLKQKKAAAAVGNPILLNKYKQFFSPYNIPIAQILCERHHFSDVYSFKQLKNTIKMLWDNGILPIANENDVIRNLEMSFSDNDELALLFGVGFNADIILLGTSVEGVYDSNKVVIPKIDKFTKEILSLASDESTALGLGGMTSKMTYTHLATTLGIETVIFGLNNENSIMDAIQGKCGTRCLPQDCSKDIRSKWLTSGCFLNGSITITDEGLKNIKNGENLLGFYITKVTKPFQKGEIIEVKDSSDQLVGIARASVSNSTLTGKQYVAKNEQMIFL